MLPKQKRSYWKPSHFWGPLVADISKRKFLCEGLTDQETYSMCYIPSQRLTWTVSFLSDVSLKRILWHFSSDLLSLSVITQTEGEFCVWGKDCGNGHWLPRVPIKTRQFLTDRILLSSFRISSVDLRWSRQQTRRCPGLFWPAPASHYSQAPVPNTRRCVRPPKKAETFRQGYASLAWPILSLCSSIQQRADTSRVYLAWSAL